MFIASIPDTLCIAAVTVNVYTVITRLDISPGLKMKTVYWFAQLVNGEKLHTGLCAQLCDDVGGCNNRSKHNIT